MKTNMPTPSEIITKSLERLANGTDKYPTHDEFVQLDSNNTLVFRFAEFGGMVGETILTVDCELLHRYQDDGGTECIERIDIIHPIAKAFYNAYKRTNSKSANIRLWHLVKSIAPETAEARAEASRQEAISRVI